MLKNHPDTYYNGITINVVILILGYVSIIHHLMTSVGNRLWISYIDVGVLTAAFMVATYLLGRKFQDLIIFGVKNNYDLKINFHSLWVTSLFGGILNGFIASFTYYQMPGLGYKLIATGLMALFMSVSFIFSIAEVVSLVEVAKYELRREFAEEDFRLLRRKP